MHAIFFLPVKWPLLPHLSSSLAFYSFHDSFAFSAAAAVAPSAAFFCLTGVASPSLGPPAPPLDGCPSSSRSSRRRLLPEPGSLRHLLIRPPVKFRRMPVKFWRPGGHIKRPDGLKTVKRTRRRRQIKNGPCLSWNECRYDQASDAARA